MEMKNTSKTGATQTQTMMVRMVLAQQVSMGITGCAVEAQVRTMMAHIASAGPALTMELSV